MDSLEYFKTNLNLKQKSKGYSLQSHVMFMLRTCTYKLIGLLVTFQFHVQTNKIQSI